MRVVKAKWPQEQFDLFENCCVCSATFKDGDAIVIDSRPLRPVAVHDPQCTFLMPHCSGGRHQHGHIAEAIGR